MEIAIRKATLEDIDLLMEWRMEVLHEVFSIPPLQNTDELEQENRAYYQRALAQEEHIACFAYMEDNIVGCGGICLYQEMPSPDNPTGKCAYLMNIYTKPQFRKRGVGEAIIKWLVAQAIMRGIPKNYVHNSLRPFHHILHGNKA